MILRSGDIEVDESLYELRRAGRPVAVQPRVFDLLRCLMRHAPRVVTRAELRSEVWHGAHVCPAAAARAVCNARRALGDDDVSPRFIQTVRGRGYRFAVDVSREGAGDPADLGIRAGRRAIVLDGDRELLERVVAYASQHGVEVRTL